MNSKIYNQKNQFNNQYNNLILKNKKPLFKFNTKFKK